VSAPPLVALEVLRAAARDGRLAELADRHALTVVTVFGSAVRGGAPRDLDVAVGGRKGRPPDVLALLDDLAVLTSCDVLDLLVLDRAGPVARERALVGCVPLYEDRPGAYATAQMAAMTERMDSDWLRALDLRLLAT
jgi:predicted nucleotidyltransferase